MGEPHKGKIPFDPVTGHMQSYPESKFVRIGGDGALVEPVWKENHEFTATMEYVGYRRGRSSALLIFQDMAGMEYPVFMSCADELIPHLVYGAVTGRFTFVKIGQNYGLKLLEAQ